jgi:hypothetical protein
MPVHPRASGLQGAAGAALNAFVLVAAGFVVVEYGDDVDGPTVDAKDRVVLSIAQNRWARASAGGTLELQLAATQE